MKYNKGKNFIKRAYDGGRVALKSIYRWIKRGFFGEKFAEGTERIESPSRLLRESFFRKKTAVGALAFLVILFLYHIKLRKISQYGFGFLVQCDK